MLILHLCLSLLVASPAPLHDYHISKTNVRYVADKQEVQVEMHLFVEDLEADMAAAGAPEKLEIGTKLEAEDAERYLSIYLQKHFRIDWNGKLLPLEIIGYELADDLHGLWIYQVATVAEGPKEVAVDCTLLTNTYSDQKNIVKIYNGQERSATLLLSKDQTKGSY